MAGATDCVERPPDLSASTAIVRLIDLNHGMVGSMVGQASKGGEHANGVHVTDDIVIPQELLDAHHDGNLVIFVGAGVSMSPPSSLPSFKELTKKLAEMACVPFCDEDGVDENGTVRAQEPKEFDRFLGKMPKNFDLRRHAMKLVSPGESLPNSTHGAVMNLADSSGCLRVVTTNYDDHLAGAASEARIDTPRRWDAPLLPQGDDFEGLVHLHGSTRGDPQGVVLTDKDFGEAYLSNGWATRFLVPMFRRFVVVFIGYSYNDLIMRYLTRGLSSEVRCYVMMDMDSSRADADGWENLGVTPIGYPVNGNDHEALVDALRAWDKLARMRQCEHRDRMTGVVRSGKNSLTTVDRDYLLGQLATVQGAENFVASCRLLSAPVEKNSWLRWIEVEVPDFSKAFRGEAVDKATEKLLQWYAETFIADPELHGAALQTVQRLGQRFNDHLLDCARSAALDLGKADKTAGDRWKILLLTSVEHPVMDSYLGPLPHAADVSVEHLAVLTEILRPHLRLISHSDCSAEDLTFPHGKLAWDADAPSVDSHLKRAIEQYGSGSLELGLILEGALLSIYQLMDAYHDKWIYWNFDESIQLTEILDQPGCPRTPANSLVEALRDYGVRAMTSDGNLVRSGGNLVQRWWSFDLPLFQRLAVHLVTESTMNVDEKINWVLDHDALYANALKLEVIRLLVESVVQATPQVKSRLLAKIKVGSYPRDRQQSAGYKDKLADYDRYTVLKLLCQKDSQWGEAKDILISLERQYPKFKPLGYQDLIPCIKGGGAGGKPPMSMEDFLCRLREDPGVVMKDLLDREYSPWEDSESAWGDVLDMVVRVCKNQADAGGLIIQGMEEQDEGHEDQVKGLHRAVVKGLGEADLSSADDSAIRAVGELVDSSDESDLNAVGEFMVQQIKIQKGSTEISLIVSMRGFAKSLWSRHVMSFKHEKSVPLSGVSPLYLSCWPGSVARYWVMEICRRWRIQGGKHGLSEEERAVLEDLLHAPDCALDATLPALANSLRFLFDVDPDFTRDELIPFFNNVDRSTLAWSAYLFNPCWTDDLLNSGLLQGMVDQWSRIDDLEGSIRDKFIMLTLDVLSSADMCSHDRVILLNETVLVKDGAFAVPFADGAMKFLAGNKTNGAKAWRAWLKDHLAKRLDGLPRGASEDELECWADIVPFLGNTVPEAVAMMRGRKIPLDERQFRVPNFPEKIFADFAEQLMLFYAERVSATIVPIHEFFPVRSFRKLVESLREYLGDKGVRPLVEAARKAGIWRS